MISSHEQICTTVASDASDATIVSCISGCPRGSGIVVGTANVSTVQALLDIVGSAGSIGCLDRWCLSDGGGEKSGECCGRNNSRGRISRGRRSQCRTGVDERSRCCRSGSKDSGCGCWW